MAFNTHYYRFVLCLLLALAGLVHADMQTLSDSDLAEVSGQALLVADKIAASAIPGAPSVDNGLTFYRIGVDGTLGFNTNIGKLQLGCGGVNDQIVAGCDIDLSNATFMGLNAAGTGAGAAVTSQFQLERPYIELAIYGDSGANRHVVGVNVASESATGYLSLGDVYNTTSNTTNLENGSTCGANANSSSDLGPGCESGLNVLSGYMKPTFTGYLHGNISGTLGVGTYTACMSPQTTVTCGTGTPTQTTGTAISCTRCVMGSTSLTNIPVHVSIGGLFGIPVHVDANIADELAYFHGIAFSGTPDFGLSVQEQQVAWPNYLKTAWNATANTGWWMNAPGNIVANVIDNSAPDLPASVAITGAFDADILNLDLHQNPAQNCYGTAHFC